MSSNASSPPRWPRPARAAPRPRQSSAPASSQLTELTGGYDFAEVIAKYWQGHDTGDEQLKSDAVRWLRGEFSTRTDARTALGVRTIIDDANFYDQLKLMARFVRLAGFDGLLVCLDEMVNLYKLANSQARNSNYEQILRILNDALQGSAAGVGFIFGGTPDFLTDTPTRPLLATRRCSHGWPRTPSPPAAASTAAAP